MTDTQLDAATEIRASIKHYREMLEFVSDMNPGDSTWPYNDEEYIRLATPPHQRIVDLYRQRISELEKQFAEVSMSKVIDPKSIDGMLVDMVHTFYFGGDPVMVTIPVVYDASVGDWVMTPEAHKIIDTIKATWQRGAWKLD